jgi:hypothetical protein
MALVSCQNCGHQISTTARRCPSCKMPGPAAGAAPLYCTRCGRQMSQNDSACRQCGAPSYTRSATVSPRLSVPTSDATAESTAAMQIAPLSDQKISPTRRDISSGDRPSFASYMLAIFCSPLYFAIQRKWGAFVVNGFFYTFALILVFTIFLAIFGVIVWMLCVMHAAWDLRGRLQDQAIQRQAAVLATAISAAQRGRGSLQ